MSRVEDILKGTYTGNPLSRIEELLLNTSIGGGGGGSVDLTPVNNRISLVENSVSELGTRVGSVEGSVRTLGTSNEETNTRVSTVEEAMTTLTTDVTTLKVHGLQDMNTE